MEFFYRFADRIGLSADSRQKTADSRQKSADSRQKIADRRHESAHRHAFVFWTLVLKKWMGYLVNIQCRLENR